jgi:hypothetical protein
MSEEPIVSTMLLSLPIVSHEFTAADAGAVAASRAAMPLAGSTKPSVSAPPACRRRRRSGTGRSRGFIFGSVVKGRRMPA